MITDRRSVLRWLGIGAATGAAAGAAIVTAVKEAKAEPVKGMPRGFKDPYHIPSDMIPKGVRYNWKRVFITSEQCDFQNINAMIQQGWRPVPFTRHPDMFRFGTSDSDINVFRPYPQFWIEIGGLVLMEKAIGA